MRAAPVVLAAALGTAAAAPAQTPRDSPQAAILARAGRYVADYYGAARTIVSREVVRLQPLDRQMRPSSEWRQLVYDVRVELDPLKPGQPSVTRTAVSAGGRLATLTARDAECFDLRATSPEPLAMLLPERQKEYTFSLASATSRSTVVFDFKHAVTGRPIVTWQGNCGTFDTNGSTVGRVWVDSQTGAVLRIDERLPTPFSYVMPLTAILDRHPVSQTVDRLETSVRYESVTFRDPDETLMLPASIRTLSVIHNSGVPQLLTLQTYGNHRRFVTGGRVVK